MDKTIEAFRKLRDVCNDVIVAMENDNVKELESAMGRFIIICMQLQELK